MVQIHSNTHGGCTLSEIICYCIVDDSYDRITESVPLNILLDVHKRALCEDLRYTERDAYLFL